MKTYVPSCVTQFFLGREIFQTKVAEMPDCWLEVSIQKVLRPATSTQVFLGFAVSISEC